MSTFGEAEAAAVFEVIDTDSSGELSKSELQDYCTSNFINWVSVFDALGLESRISITSNGFKKAAAEGKLGMFAKTGDHGLSARNLSSAAAAEPESKPEFEFLHIGLSNADAETLLLADHGENTTGKYLIRQRQTEVGSGKYILSVIYKGKVTNHFVGRTSDGTLSINGADSKISDMAEFAAHLGQKQKAIKWPVPLIEGVPSSGSSDADATGGLFQYLHAITREDAEALLLEEGGAEVTGKYLFRQAGQLGDVEPESAILCVVYKGKVTHHAVTTTEEGFLAINKKVSECKTLEELTTFCKSRQESIGWPVPLVQGVPRS